MSDILVVIPVYNAENYIKKCITSLKKQTIQDFRCIVVDDASTDNTFEEAMKVMDGRFTIARNKENIGGLANIVKMINLGESVANIHDETIICTLDGDDWFTTDKALETVVNKYEETDCLLTYGTYIHSNGSYAPVHHRNPVPEEVKKNRDYRSNTFYTSQLRTFKKKLWDQIDKEDMKNSDGEYYKSGWDLSFMFPMCEMAGDRIEHIDKAIYCYNIDNPLNDHKVNREEQLSYDKEIRNKPKYESMEDEL